MSTSSQFVKECRILGKIKCDFLQNSIFAKKIRGGALGKKTKKTCGEILVKSAKILELKSKILDVSSMTKFLTQISPREEKSQNGLRWGGGGGGVV